METLFKKYYWVIKALGLVVISGLAASAVITALGTQLALAVSEPDEDDDKKDKNDKGDDLDEDDAKTAKGFKKLARGSANATPTPSLAAAKTRTADDIRKFNMFCPMCVPIVETPEGDSTGVPAMDAIRDGIQPGEIKSALALRLMATMEAEDVEYSFATVYDLDNSITGIYGQGDTLRPGVVLVGVDAGLVHLRNNTQLEYLEVGGDAKATPKPKKTSAKKPKKKKKNTRGIPGAKEAINCPSENLCIVERKFVEQLMANPASLAKQARIVPSQKDGETQGFKFYGIRRGSLPKLLGLKNGDMLTSVNGEDMRSIDQAMGLVLKLRRASNLSVTLVRKGKTVTKEIQIQ